MRNLTEFEAPVRGVTGAQGWPLRALVIPGKTEEEAQ